MSQYTEPKITIDEIQRILKFISKGYKVPDIIKDVVYKVAKEEIEEKDKVVIIKRDPNVERERMQAARVKIIKEGDAIRLFPSQIQGFGADFDGDTLICKVLLKINNIEKEIHIKDIVHEPYITFKEEIVKENNLIIKKYNINETVDLQIKSINIETGETEWKQITEYSEHFNLEMYKIEDSKKRFETFWSSSDHSLLVYNSKEDIIEKVTPKELIDRKEERLYFIKEN